MPERNLVHVLRRFQGMLGLRPMEQTADDALLEQFVRVRNEEAFAALVQRHGPARPGSVHHHKAFIPSNTGAVRTAFSQVSQLFEFLRVSNVKTKIPNNSEILRPVAALFTAMKYSGPGPATPESQNRHCTSLFPLVARRLSEN